MSIRNDVTVDWNVSPRIIIIAKNGVASESISLQDLIDTLRFIEYQADAQSYPYLIDSYGKQNLRGGVLVGITLVLKNAKLAFEARPPSTFVQCNISGGNLVAVDVNGGDMDAVETTAYTQVVMTSSSSATLQELADIEYASFNGGVTIDVTSSNNGIKFPVGTSRQPVNNLADAMLIAVVRGFSTIFVVGGLTINAGSDYSNMIFVGESCTKTKIIINPAANVVGCEFFNAGISGTLDGNATLNCCHIGTVNYIYGVIKSCLLGLGIITLGGNETAHILDCWSGTVGLEAPAIDFGISGQSLNLQNFNGEIKFINKTGSDHVDVGLNSGHIDLATSVTVVDAGDIVISGTGRLTNNAVNPENVDSTYLLQGDDLITVKKMNYNKAVYDKDTKIVTIYEENETDVWKEFDLSDGGRIVV